MESHSGKTSTRLRFLAHWESVLNWKPAFTANERRRESWLIRNLTPLIVFDSNLEQDSFVEVAKSSARELCNHKWRLDKTFNILNLDEENCLHYHALCWCAEISKTKTKQVGPPRMKPDEIGKENQHAVRCSASIAARMYLCWLEAYGFFPKNSKSFIAAKGILKAVFSQADKSSVEGLVAEIAESDFSTHFLRDSDEDRISSAFEGVFKFAKKMDEYVKAGVSPYAVLR